jgi:hypothetical protein
MLDATKWVSHVCGTWVEMTFFDPPLNFMTGTGERGIWRIGDLKKF